MSDTSKANLINRLDGFFMKLLEDADPSIRESEQTAQRDGSQVGFTEKLKLFEAGSRWVAVKHKLDPDQDDDEFSKLRRGYSGKGRSRPTGNGS